MWRIAVLLSLGVSCLAQTQLPSDAVLIRAPKPYATLVNAIQSRGGVVTHQFKYVDAIAARIPISQLGAIGAMLPAGAIAQDRLIPAPVPVNRSSMRAALPANGAQAAIMAESAQVLSAAGIATLATVSPGAYLVNNAINGSAAFHAGGVNGQGVVVAVIDSGIRPGFPHISLDNSVIGCEDFVNDGRSCSDSRNDGHGTFVAGMISANVIFNFSTGSSLRDAVLAECPACFANPPENTQIPMVGTAPMSSIYAMRIWGADLLTRASFFMTALERAIALREKYDAGDPTGLNIQVCNMSWGTVTEYAGRDLLDSLIDTMLAKGIVPVACAANAGPSSLTVSSPATSRSAIAVGAANLAHNDRIWWRFVYGPTTGPKVRPFLGTQTAYFSSRGPNADGRVSPDVMANGVASFGQGFSSSTGIDFADGTSFAAPSVAGVAALLRQAFPTATARQIRNAIIASANPAIFEDGSTVLDRGNGYVDATAARALLASGTVPDSLPPPPASVKSVKVNIENGSGLNVRDGFVTEQIAGLKPGQRSDVLYRVTPNTNQVIVTVSGVTPALPRAEQNQLYGDDILLAVHSATTSAVGSQGDYKVLAFTTGGVYVVDQPGTGIMRITLNGSWTNAGKVSARVSVDSTKDPIPRFTVQGEITQGQLLTVPVNVPAGTAKAEFRLSWREDWGNYPASDLQLALRRPDGSLDQSGITDNNPEIITVNNPAAGTWRALIYALSEYTNGDKYEFRVTLDGVVVK